MAQAGSDAGGERGGRLRFEQALLIERNLVMRDEASDSWWQQLSGTAIAGPLQGRTLEEITYALVTWRQWRGGHPTTTVVLGEPDRDYSPVREGSR